MKIHLTTIGKKGLRCPGLKKVIPSDVWENQILPYYKNNAPLPDSSELKRYLFSSPGPNPGPIDFDDFFDFFDYNCHSELIETLISYHTCPET